MVLSRYPADNFIVPFMLINKGDKDIRVIKVSSYLIDGTIISEEKLDEALKPTFMRIADGEIRSICGIVSPDKKSLAQAKYLLNEAQKMKKGEERDKKIELAWLLLGYKAPPSGYDKDNLEAKRIISFAGSFHNTIQLKYLSRDMIPNDYIPIITRITFKDGNNSTFTISKEVNLLYLQSLPNRPGWYPGDGHIHTSYSDGNETIEQRRDYALNLGLKWLIITDHGWRTLINNWELYKMDCNNAQNKTPHITVCPGEEIATSENYHYLGYNITTPIADHSRSSQDTINTVNNQGGFGVIAHPFTGYPWSNWGVTGFKGLELISNSNNAHSSALSKWDELLTNNISNIISNPDRYIIGTSNSDMHNYATTPYFGKNITYIYTGDLVNPPGTNRNVVYANLRNGRVSASSDASLAVFSLNGFAPGNVIIKLSHSQNVNIDVWARCVHTLVDNARVFIYRDGGSLVHSETIHGQQTISRSYTLPYPGRDTYYRVYVIFNPSTGALPSSHCYVNPIFVDVP